MMTFYFMNITIIVVDDIDIKKRQEYSDFVPKL